MNRLWSPDRLHLQLILDVRSERLVPLVEAAGRGGVDSIQIRSKGLAAGELLGRTLAVLDALEVMRERPLVIVNDRVDVALLAGADGVHLPGDSFAPPWAAAIRRLALADEPGAGDAAHADRATSTRRFIVGRSIHAADAVVRTGTDRLDYVTFGHVFASESKPGRPPRGLRALAEAAASSPVPVLAVGGLGPDNVQQAVRAGAEGVAVISAVAEAKDPSAAVSELRRALDVSAAAKQ